jgi:hypothetical protein
MGFCSVALQLFVAQVCLGCGSDSNNIEPTECALIGETEPCDCASGASGTKVCLSDGTYSSCDCFASARQPCKDPGQESACTCSGGGQGTRLCLDTGRFTKCRCAAASTAVAGSGATAAPADGGAATSASSGASACPAGMSCGEQSVGGQSAKVCNESTGYPPFCDTVGDCTSKGLSATAMCMAVSGVKVCVQLCQ